MIPNRTYVQQTFALLCALASLTCSSVTLAFETSVQIVEVGEHRFEVTLPKGFRFDILDTTLRSPRLISFLPNGHALIGSRTGRLYLAAPPYDKPQLLLRWRDTPQSAAFLDDHIVFAGTVGLYRAPYTLGQTQVDPATVTKIATLPGGPGHDSRSVGVGPDNKLYVSIGISGNCSDEYLGEAYAAERQRGGILRLEGEAGSFRLSTYATGLRNPVGFDWDPATATMYASNNGPDHLGYEQPPEYFAKITEHSFHGMPWFQYDGTKVHPDSCAASAPPRPIEDVSPPAATFPARNAPMGVAFVPQGALSAEFTGGAVVALHGSWATQPHGSGDGDPATRRPAKLVFIPFSGGAVAGPPVDLVTGFQLANGARWLRPFGVDTGPDGALYFTSDGGLKGLFRLTRR